jgi:hypothetical protein
MMGHKHLCKWCDDVIDADCRCKKIDGPVEICDGMVLVRDAECLVCFQENTELRLACGG